MKYVIYLRVSKEIQEYGIQAQRDACLEFIAKKQPAAQSLEFVDEGYSGSLPLEQRPGLLDALQTLQKDDILLVARRDRLGRNAVQNAIIEHELKKKKCKIVCVAQNDESMDEGTADLFKTILDAIAQYELYLIKIRTRQGMHIARKEQRRLGHIPYGYKAVQHATQKTKKDKPVFHIHLDDHEQSIVERMVRLNDQGLGSREIAKRLNADGVCTRSGGKWSHVSIFKILTNRPKHLQTYQGV